MKKTKDVKRTNATEMSIINILMRANPEWREQRAEVSGGSSL